MCIGGMLFHSLNRKNNFIDFYVIKFSVFTAKCGTIIIKSKW